MVERALVGCKVSDQQKLVSELFHRKAITHLLGFSGRVPALTLGQMVAVAVFQLTVELRQGDDGEGQLRHDHLDAVVAQNRLAIHFFPTPQRISQ